MDDDTIVCTCMNISVKDMKDAINAGAASFQDLQDQTGVGTVCGVCIDEAEALFQQLKDEVQK